MKRSLTIHSDLYGTSKKFRRSSVPYVRTEKRYTSSVIQYLMETLRDTVSCILPYLPIEDVFFLYQWEPHAGPFVHSILPRRNRYCLEDDEEIYPHRFPHDREEDIRQLYRRRPELVERYWLPYYVAYDWCLGYVYQDRRGDLCFEAQASVEESEPSKHTIFRCVIVGSEKLNFPRATFLFTHALLSVQCEIGNADKETHPHRCIRGHSPRVHYEDFVARLTYVHGPDVYRAPCSYSILCKRSNPRCVDCDNGYKASFDKIEYRHRAWGSCRYAYVCRPSHWFTHLSQFYPTYFRGTIYRLQHQYQGKMKMEWTRHHPWNQAVHILLNHDSHNSKR